ncbi:hypothetical protein, partial [Klebsiella pneumoniae]|uniref:hypothetical protein n=1 Tax=Klebsiella pneumoniae TaxID=573 RepID=UPI003013CC04
DNALFDIPRAREILYRVTPYGRMTGEEIVPPISDAWRGRIQTMPLAIEGDSFDRRGCSIKGFIGRQLIEVSWNLRSDVLDEVIGGGINMQ